MPTLGYFTLDSAWVDPKSLLKTSGPFEIKGARYVYKNGPLALFLYQAVFSNTSGYSYQVFELTVNPYSVHPTGLFLNNKLLSPEGNLYMDGSNRLVSDFSKTLPGISESKYPRAIHSESRNSTYTRYLLRLPDQVPTISIPVLPDHLDISDSELIWYPPHHKLKSWPHILEEGDEDNARNTKEDNVREEIKINL